MSTHELISKLSQMPAEIHAQEERLLLVESGLAAARDNLTLAEDGLLLAGTIDGKNAELRAAQLRRETASLRSQVAELEASAARARATVRFRQNELSSLKAVARLLAGSGD